MTNWFLFILLSKDMFEKMTKISNEDAISVNMLFLGEIEEYAYTIT